MERDVAQFGSALEWGSRGRRFESGRPDQHNPLSSKRRLKNSAMAESQDQNKRSVPRVGREIIVHYRIKDVPHLGDFQVAFKPPTDLTRSRDLAERGIFFTASQPIAVKTVLEFQLQLPSQKASIELEGEVLDCAEIKKDFIYGIRVEFVNLGEKKRESLKNFVQLFLKS